MVIVCRTMGRFVFTDLRIFSVRHQYVYSCASYAENHLLLWIDKIVLCVCLCATPDRLTESKLIEFFVVRVISTSPDVDYPLPTFFRVCCWLFENIVHSFASVCFRERFFFRNNSLFSSTFFYIASMHVRWVTFALQWNASAPHAPDYNRTKSSSARTCSVISSLRRSTSRLNGHRGVNSISTTKCTRSRCYSIGFYLYSPHFESAIVGHTLPVVSLRFSVFSKDQRSTA